MSSEYQYTTLICSLPAYESLYESRQTPISRIQLENRLNLLESEDARDIKMIEDVLDWHRHPSERSDRELLSIVAKALPTIRSQFVRDMLVWRLELRSIVALMRHRHYGTDYAEASQSSYGRWQLIIKRHWQEPGLGLDKFFPWVMEVQRHLESGDCMALERCILSEVWAWLDQLSCGHEFDFPAVAIYRMRWDLLARWTSYDKEKSKNKFDQLLSLAIGEQNFSAALN